MPAGRRYDPLPCYPSVGGAVVRGWADICASLPATAELLAVDGPAVLAGSGLDWPQLAEVLATELRLAGRTVELVDARDFLAGWDQIHKRTAPVEALQDDPDFATMAGGSLADLFDEVPAVPRAEGVTAIVFGPGAALSEHDVLWYADVPKRFAEAAVVAGEAGNLGQPAGEAGNTRRLFYIDWPLLDRFRDSLAPHIDRWIDLQHAAGPTSLSGESLRASAAVLAARPLRTCPTFNTTSWGGHWAQDELGFNPQARNTALGYELIAPESGVLLGGRDTYVEVPFQLLVTLQPVSVLGQSVYDRFGTSFPVRFDYLDTVGGGSLSVHCHPREDIMRDQFGWPYTQHESYYVMVGSSQNTVYLGLRDDADLDEFHARAHDAAEHGVLFDIEQFVQTFPADPHQLFLIPGGTPHGSGQGNVVLEVSATPYLYSLRFYDWLRNDAGGAQRPVHVEHAFANLDRDRRGAAVRSDLVQPARPVEQGNGWCDELIGSLPEMFFEVRRVVVEPGSAAPLSTAQRFCVFTVVEGDGAVIRWHGGQHDLAYAETIVVPAAVGDYEVAAVGDKTVRLVRAFVP